MFNFNLPSWLWDAGTMVFVALAFFYAAALSRKFAKFYKNRHELERLLNAFSQSLTGAETSLSQLRQKTAEFEESLNGKIRTATSLVDDLRFFSERGEALMKELDREVRKAREAKQDLLLQESTEGTLKKPEIKQSDSLSVLPTVKDSGGFLQQATGLH